MANETEAPTSAATTAALEARTATHENSDITDFVQLQHQYYSLNGRLMPLSVAVNGYSFAQDEFVALATDPAVIVALEERGINTREFKALSNSGAVGIVEPDPDQPVIAESWQEVALTPLQLIVANTMLDLIDTRSQKKKLQDLGVSTAMYNTWLNDPTFQGYLRARAESMLGENQHEAHLALLDKVRQGDSKALSMYYEMTGMFVPERGGNAGTQSQQDFKLILFKILEIIQEEVPIDYQFTVGERIRALVTTMDTASQLVQAGVDPNAETIVKPKVAPARVLSPRLQELMDKGVNID